MILTLKKQLTLALILFVGVMQMFLPFLHAHYQSDSMHIGGSTDLLHIHAVELNAELIGDSGTNLGDQIEASVLSMDRLLPNKNNLNDLECIFAIVVTLMLSCALIHFVKVLLTKPIYQQFSYTNSLSRAPPQYS